jgi:hypothetical protein
VDGAVLALHEEVQESRGIQEALHSIANEVPLQIVDLRVSQFYSMCPRVEIIINTVGGGTRPLPKKETSI